MASVDESDTSRKPAKSNPIVGAGLLRLFFDSHRRGRNLGSVSDDIGFVLDDPLNDLAFLELEGLGHGGGEVYVILIGALFAGDELNFSRVSHGVLFLKYG